MKTLRTIYIGEIKSLCLEIKNMGIPLDDKFVGVIMLYGLSSEIKSMIEALEDSRVTISSDFVKKLLQINAKKQPINEKGDSIYVPFFIKLLSNTD